MFTKQSFWLPDRFCHSCLFVYLYVINYLITKRDLKREDVPKFFCLSLYPIYIYVYIYIYIYYLVRIKTKKKAKKLRFIFFWDLRDLSKLLTTFKYQHVWNLHIKDLIAFAGRGMNEKIYWNIWHLTYIVFIGKSLRFQGQDCFHTLLIQNLRQLKTFYR